MNTSCMGRILNTGTHGLVPNTNPQLHEHKMHGQDDGTQSPVHNTGQLHKHFLHGPDTATHGLVVDTDPQLHENALHSFVRS